MGAASCSCLSRNLVLSDDNMEVLRGNEEGRFECNDISMMIEEVKKKGCVLDNISIVRKCHTVTLSSIHHSIALASTRISSATNLRHYRRKLRLLGLGLQVKYAAHLR